MGVDQVAGDNRDNPTIDLLSYLTNQGRAFNVPARFTDIGNGDAVNLFIDNPDGSGFDYDVVLLPRATGLVDLDVSFGATENDATATSVVNLKSGSSRTFSGSASLFDETNDTGTPPAHGTSVVTDFIPGGGSGQNITAQVVDSTAFTIDEGSNKLLEITNSSSGTLKRMALNLLLYEVNGRYKTRE